MWPFRFAMHGKRGLRMMVVTLVSSSPKNGVEIMDGVETMTRGWWRPTPGSIYPLLTKMVEEGTLSKREDGKYELTPNAKQEYEVSFGPRPRRAQGVDDILGEMQSLVSYLEDLGESKASEVQSRRESMKEIARRINDLADKSS